jgi:hypothetical protein
MATDAATRPIDFFHMKTMEGFAMPLHEACFRVVFVTWHGLKPVMWLRHRNSSGFEETRSIRMVAGLENVAHTLTRSRKRI